MAKKTTELQIQELKLFPEHWTNLHERWSYPKWLSKENMDVVIIHSWLKSKSVGEWSDICLPYSVPKNFQLTVTQDSLTLENDEDFEVEWGKNRGWGNIQGWIYSKRIGVVGIKIERNHSPWCHLKCTLFSNTSVAHFPTYWPFIGWDYLWRAWESNVP